ncbi:12106_t:CDS:2 [Ambispora leptoticha]|uniref:12106_t:CDS:1 n=1 Tax=Ambispora leptoticha TaxID=144679 RepID=A0A9N8W177_9GLOM|nr:12106_t:CDS:2 [Ambispora leptoticha]
MIVSFSPIPANFQGNDEEFEDICVMHRIIDSVGRVENVKKIEKDLNKMPVFGIQVTGETMACWIMTMLFGAFYFVQHLGSVQIPMNRGQSLLARFMDEL